MTTTANVTNATVDTAETGPRLPPTEALGLGVRLRREELTPVACGFEPQYGLLVTSMTRTQLTSSATNETVQSVRYTIDQDRGDYDEQEYRGRLLFSRRKFSVCLSVEGGAIISPAPLPGEQNENDPLQNSTYFINVAGGPRLSCLEKCS